MNWKKQLHSPQFRTGICIFLLAALLLGLFVPGLPFRREDLKDPLQEQQIQDIHPVRLGDDSDGRNAIVIPVEGAEDSDNKQEVSEGDGIAGEGEAESGETRPEEVLPVEQEGERTDQEENSTGSGTQGQEDGNSGEEGGNLTQLDLAAVMTWERYGEDTTLVCSPYQTVATTVNLAQLEDNVFCYGFSLTGSDAKGIEITGVTVAAGNEMPANGEVSGELRIQIPEGADSQSYFFQLEAEGKNADGENQTVQFTYILKCEDMPNLNLVLEWNRYNGETGAITCLADRTANRTVESGDLENGIFAYKPTLTGSEAENAQLISGEYRSISGETGELDLTGGTLQLQPAAGQTAMIYDLIFHAMLGERTVSYTITLHYQDVVSVRLNACWFAGDTLPVNQTCLSSDSIVYDIKSNQIRNGSARFLLTLEGEDAQGAIFTSVSFQSSLGTGGSLQSDQASPDSFSFQLPMDLENETVSTYTVTVLVLADGETLQYTIQIRYGSDVGLQMRYTLADGTQQQILCENGKEKTAEPVYTDQLTDGELAYTMTLVGDEAETLKIKKVSCYQSGDRRNKTLEAEGNIRLLLNGQKSGENAFTVTAESEAGERYAFVINIPYKQKGANSVRFWTSLSDHDTVINETVNNFSVRAWSEGENNTIISNIRDGGQQRLVVTLDGVRVPMTTTAGSTMEYDLYPSNPETGDANTHTIHIYAEDEYGNYGEKTITLNGQRRQPGQVLGTATIQVDMTVLGKSIESVAYTVLADEPASFAVAKAIWGHDAGDPFGRADHTLGWRRGSYEGTLEEGFYLSRLYYGGPVNAKAISAGDWRDCGSTEAAVLAYIDRYFGEGTALASLWRCIYRNGLEKSTGAEDSIGEFDYTNGSGWIYSLNGGYFPGESMCAYYLRDGDVLTLRYTLAYGWDVGSGTPGYEGNYGYCVWGENGRLQVSHNWVDITDADGNRTGSRCTCCAVEAVCIHPDARYVSQADGTHVQYCPDCRKNVTEPEDHIWSEESITNSQNHICRTCGYTGTHRMHEISDTATCTAAGVRTSICWDCGYVSTYEYVKPHQYQGMDHNAAGHWQVCQMCSVQVNFESHSYTFDTREWGWVCSCGIMHGMEYCRGIFLEEGEPVEADCQKKTYYCDSCGKYFHMYGTFDEYHSYSEGICIHCGKPEPGYVPPEQPEE